MYRTNQFLQLYQYILKRKGVYEHKHSYELKLFVIHSFPAGHSTSHLTTHMPHNLASSRLTQFYVPAM
uniref:Uncharacterized protein n=1 Tax=Aegilops tauschii subsp. strangulata TaxID=200361 RepID=A0A453A4N1_AEGTS